MVLKRCIYGVDKNPLTVELAKVSLWLHSFTVGAPLSFLDHHLRCGDSLVGLRVREAQQDFERLGGLFLSGAVAGAETAVEGMQRIEQMSDADVAEVRESAALFRNVEEATADLRGVLDFLCGLRWQTAGMKRLDRMSREGLLSENFGGSRRWPSRCWPSGPDSIPPDAPIDRDASWSAFNDLWNDAIVHSPPRALSALGSRLPRRLARLAGLPSRGRIRRRDRQPAVGPHQAARGRVVRDPRPELARAPTAAARRAGIRQLRETGSAARRRLRRRQGARRQARCANSSARPATIPLLGKGDINLYSLFVERAMSLIKPDGLVGLLTPSGIYADKTAARFFKSVSTKRPRVRPVRLREPPPRNGTAAVLPRRGLKVQILRPDIRRRRAALRRDRRAPSSSTTQRPSPTATAAFRWRRTTSPASTPTPAPPRSFAGGATPISPAASTSGIPCSWTAQAMTSAAPGRFGSCRECSDMTIRLPSLPYRVNS